MKGLDCEMFILSNYLLKLHPKFSLSSRTTFQRLPFTGIGNTLILKTQYTSCPTSKPKHCVTYKPYMPSCYKDHDHKNMMLNRPMSPHLTIYAPTLPAMTSISQRITGIILAFYAVLISGTTLFLTNGTDAIVSLIQSLNLSENMIILFKVILGLPFSYHYFCGMRFCAWNAGKLLSLKHCYSTGYMAILCTPVLAVAFAIIDKLL